MEFEREWQSKIIVLDTMIKPLETDYSPTIEIYLFTTIAISSTLNLNIIYTIGTIKFKDKTDIIISIILTFFPEVNRKK